MSCYHYIKERNFSTLLSYLWSLIDIGTDIWVGIDYRQKCHFRWAITTFVISFMPNIVFAIWFAFSVFIDEGKCNHGEQKRCLLLLSYFQFNRKMVWSIEKISKVYQNHLCRNSRHCWGNQFTNYIWDICAQTNQERK